MLTRAATKGTIVALGHAVVDRGAAKPPVKSPARITRELQERGVVAEGVEPALTPIYHGVKAAAFRIPREMVAILSEENSMEVEQ